MKLRLISFLGIYTIMSMQLLIANPLSKLKAAKTQLEAGKKQISDSIEGLKSKYKSELSVIVPKLTKGAQDATSQRDELTKYYEISIGVETGLAVASLVPVLQLAAIPAIAMMGDAPAVVKTTRDTVGDIPTTLNTVKGNLEGPIENLNPDKDPQKVYAKFNAAIAAFDTAIAQSDAIINLFQSKLDAGAKQLKDGADKLAKAPEDFETQIKPIKDMPAQLDDAKKQLTEQIASIDKTRLDVKKQHTELSTPSSAQQLNVLGTQFKNDLYSALDELEQALTLLADSSTKTGILYNVQTSVANSSNQVTTNLQKINAQIVELKDRINNGQAPCSGSLPERMKQLAKDMQGS